MRALRATLVGFVVASAALVAGCGDDESPEVAQVKSYMQAVRDVEREAAPRFAAATDAYKRYAGGELKGKAAGSELRRVELDVANAQNAVSALRPPPEARRLHEALLRSYEVNVLMAAEMRQMAGYIPRAQEALQRFDRAQTRLRRGLRSKSADGQMAALRAYSRALRAVVERLSSLEVPASLAADRDTQLRILGRTQSLADRLIDALRRQDAVRIRSLLGEFGEAKDPQPELGDLAKSSLGAYRQRIVMVNRAAALVRAERARLQGNLQEQ